MHPDDNTHVGLTLMIVGNHLRTGDQVTFDSEGDLDLFEYSFVECTLSHESKSVSIERCRATAAEITLMSDNIKLAGCVLVNSTLRLYASEVDLFGLTLINSTVTCNAVNVAVGQSQGIASVISVIAGRVVTTDSNSRALVATNHTNINDD